MKMKPLLVAFGELKFACPVCETELTTDKCSKCGQLIDCDDFEIDVCPAEVLTDHRDVEEVEKSMSNRWITIGESLPEENQKVWVTNEYHGGSRRVEESVYRNEEFYETGYSTSKIVCTDLVKAWCPRFVPEPYKEVSKE